MTVDFWMTKSRLASARANGRTKPTLAIPKAPFYLSSGAVDEWRLGLGSQCLTGIVNRTLMVPNADPPDYTALAEITLANVNNAGLLSGVDEAASECHCYVMRNNVPSGNQMLGGSGTATAGDGGWILYRQPGTFAGIRVLTRGIATNTTNDLSAIPAGRPFFVAVSHVAGTRILYIGGVGAFTQAGTKTISTPLRQISIGNVHYSTGWDRQPRFFFYSAYAASKTSGELDAIYANVKIMMARVRGIAIF